MGNICFTSGSGDAGLDWFPLILYILFPRYLTAYRDYKNWSGDFRDSGLEAGVISPGGVNPVFHGTTIATCRYELTSVVWRSFDVPRS